MKLFFFLWRISRRLVALVIAAGIIGGISSTGLIAVIHRALDKERPMEILTWSFIGLCIVVLITKTVSLSLLVYIGQRAINDLRIDLSRQILATPLRQLEEIGVHRILAVLIDDVTNITFALAVIPNICVGIAIVTFCITYIGWLSGIVLFVLLVFMVLGIVSYRLLVAVAIPFLKRGRKEGDNMFKHFRALTEGIQELKLHQKRRKDFFSRLIQPTAALYKRNNTVGGIIYMAAGSWGDLLFFILIGLLLFSLPSFKNIDTQTLTGSIFVILYLISPLSAIVSQFPVISRADVALQNIDALGFSLGNAPVEDYTVDLNEPLSFEKLELLGINHKYYREKDDDHFSLGPLDLSFSPGELVFLIGGNGSGKTTLAKLITGLYIPESGEIMVDGRPVTNETRERYRQLFSVVFSNFYLFEDLLGLNSSGVDARALDYLKELHLNHKVEVKDGSFSTTSLSQGQRKRLALLVAYLEDRPFYVFDEWASDQDPLFKEVFYTRLLPELKSRGKTILVITHDEKFFFLADRIIKLDYGKIEDMQAQLLERRDRL